MAKTTPLLVEDSVIEVSRIYSITFCIVIVDQMTKTRLFWDGFHDCNFAITNVKGKLFRSEPSHHHVGPF